MLLDVFVRVVETVVASAVAGALALGVVLVAFWRDELVAPWCARLAARLPKRLGKILQTAFDLLDEHLRMLGQRVASPFRRRWDNVRESPTLRTLGQWGAYLFRQTREKLYERDENGNWRLRTPPSS